jgi:hypothetical protein
VLRPRRSVASPRRPRRSVASPRRPRRLSRSRRRRPRQSHRPRFRIRLRPLHILRQLLLPPRRRRLTARRVTTRAYRQVQMSTALAVPATAPGTCKARCVSPARTSTDSTATGTASDASRCAALEGGPRRYRHAVCRSRRRVLVESPDAGRLVAVAHRRADIATDTKASLWRGLPSPRSTIHPLAATRRRHQQRTAPAARRGASSPSTATASSRSRRFRGRVGGTPSRSVHNTPAGSSR